MNNGKVVLIKILLFQNALHISVNYTFQKKLFFSLHTRRRAEFKNSV